MKVNIQLESTDTDGAVSGSNISAVMQKRENDYRLVYVEDLSGDGKMTKSIMLLSDTGLRITRTGELRTDFMYGQSMTHHTSYETPYGRFPVTLETEDYDFKLGGDEFIISAETGYRLIVGGQEPLFMRMKIRVTPIS